MPSARFRRGWSFCCSAALVPLFAVAWSCASHSGPSQAVERYVTAVERNRPEIAYAQLNSKVRSQLSWEEFRRRWQNTSSERRQQAAELRKQLGQLKQGRSLSATARYEDGLEISLVCAKDEWRISGNPFGLRARTPTEVVRSLMRALEQRDYRELLKLIAEPTRKVIEQAVEERLSEIKQSLDHQIEVTGNKAQLHYGTRYRIELVREQGEWRILDFDLF